MVLVIFLLLAVVNAKDLPIPIPQKLEFSYEGSRNCDDFDGKINLENIVLEQIGENVMALSGDFVLKTEMPENVIVKVTISRCPSRAERGICESIPPQIIDNVCDRLPEKDKEWSGFVEKLEHFVPTCPVQPGNYHFDEYVVDMSTLASAPLMEAYWILNSEAFVGKERVMCIFSEIEFKSTNKRKMKLG
ncbi:hypothetical protein L9F63_009333 [Diploptera punctata]|uniref:Uncharacterized protein n=1 Tax=Diploptera punctata TaxID=6984 RepID=A0AAD8AJK5_DIPPU|nr:hypothetical protein L9F63_009333 [Diploptera punctata]